MTVGVLKENPGETRVSLLPEHIKLLAKKNIKVLVETEAGTAAFASDTEYQNAGAEIASREQVLQQAELILQISAENLPELNHQKTFIGQFNVLSNPSFIDSCIQGKHSVFSLDLLPRTTRAQSMDVLSSQANIAGYKAVLHAATHYPRYFPMFMTAAGSIPPAKVLILGAGVAGLQAIATARRLGAVVEVFDTRPQVKEEVMSLGAKFIDVEGAADASSAGGYAVEQSKDFQQKQKEKIAASAAKADIIITTAQIPGRKAPILITDEMLDAMRPGSVIVDLAAATGGNTTQTKNAETITYKGITIIGNSALAATMPSDASKVFGKNLCNFIDILVDENGILQLNFEDELIAGACLTYQGELINDRVKSLLQL